jgi:surface antigen
VHFVVLAVAVAMSGYASIDKQLPSLGLHVGALDAQGLIMAEGGQVGDVTLGRMSTIIQPVAVPTSTPLVHGPIPYTVAAGDNLQSIANQFQVTPQMIRWSNPALASTDRVNQGEQLVIPPVSGLVVTVKSGDTIQTLAAAYHSDPDAIVDFNRLRDDALIAGSQLVIPAGTGPDLVSTSSTPQTPRTRPTTRTSRSRVPTDVTLGGQAGPNRNSMFPYGYCTWYVATRRVVTWSGNASQWYANAAAQGYAVGKSPRVGAIMDTWESGWGHVAYVEQVNPDGSWVVSEMNYRGWGIIDQRVIAPGSVPLIGFIY